MNGDLAGAPGPNWRGGVTPAWADAPGWATRAASTGPGATDQRAALPPTSSRSNTVVAVGSSRRPTRWWRGLARGLLAGALLALLLAALWWTAPPLPQLSAGAAGAPDVREEVVEGVVLAVETVRPAAAPSEGPLTSVVPAVTVRVRITRGTPRGREVNLALGTGAAPDLATAARSYAPGDRVLLAYLPDQDSGSASGVGSQAMPAADGGDGDSSGDAAAFRLIDHVRAPWLLWAAALFAVVVVVVARGQGARALVGLLAAVGVLWWFIMPRLLAGQPPVPVALVGCALIAVPALLLTMGVGRASLVPLAGIAGSLAVVGVLTTAAVHVAHISGLAANEELSMVFVETRGVVNPQGLLLAAMLIGTIGGLVDVTVGQAAAIFELHEADPSTPRAELLRRGMNVGRAHVAAAVHTLILAYAGAALPLLLLITINAPDLGNLWNRELIGVEVLRSVAGSIGLALAMPLTSWFACLTCCSAPARRRPAPYAGVGAVVDWRGERVTPPASRRLTPTSHRG